MGGYVVYCSVLVGEGVDVSEVGVNGVGWRM